MIVSLQLWTPVKSRREIEGEIRYNAALLFIREVQFATERTFSSNSSFFRRGGGGRWLLKTQSIPNYIRNNLHNSILASFPCPKAGVSSLQKHVSPPPPPPCPPSPSLRFPLVNPLYLPRRRRRRRRRRRNRKGSVLVCIYLKKT